MKSISMALLMFCIAFFSFCQSNSDKNENNFQKQNRTVEDFTGIKVENAISLVLTQGNSNSVSVSTSNSEDQKRVITEVENGILNVKLESGIWSWKNRKIIVHVSMQSIASIEASGASDIKITNKLLSEDLKIKLTGASSLKGEIKGLKLNVGLSGASTIKLNGIGGEVNIKATGASSCKGFDFNCENAKIEASGASEINISVNKSLFAKASGASSINYKGNPSVKEIKSSGASSIKQKQD